MTNDAKWDPEMDPGTEEMILWETETNGCLVNNTVQFSCSVMFDSFRPHGQQHARLPCPSPSPRAYSNSHPLSR